MSIQEIFNEIIEERKRQDEKWGIQNHSLEKWMTILGEEYGEVCKEVLELPHIGKLKDVDIGLKNIKKELIQIIAVSVAIIQNYDTN